MSSAPEPQRVSLLLASRTTEKLLEMAELSETSPMLAMKNAVDLSFMVTSEIRKGHSLWIKTPEGLRKIIIKGLEELPELPELDLNDS